MTGTIFNELMLDLEKMKAISEQERLSIHRLFAAFYNNDYLLINQILKRNTLDNPFSQETLNKMNFQHLDVTQKILNRLSSGIYTEQAIRELIISEKVIDKNLDPLLKSIRYNAKVKDSFRKSLYFNVILAMPVYDDELKRMRIDVITPDQVEIETKNDYLEIKSLKIEKARPDGTCYYTVWTDTQHYIIDGEDKLPPVNNETGKNPFGKIPVSILRMKEGINFWGEPNWNLLLNQMNLDIRLTDMNEGELRTIHQFWVGYNTKFKDNERFTAGEIKQVDDDPEKPARVESLLAGIDYASIRDNIDWKVRTVMNSEGISAQSGSVEATDESGIKRMIDELELEERRDDFKEILYNFEIDLLNNIRLVNNKYQKTKLNETGYFEVTFSEEKAAETINDKVTRREMENAVGYHDEVDFTMQDLEVSEKEAIKILQVRKNRMKELGLEKENSENPEDKNNSNNENNEQ